MLDQIPDPITRFYDDDQQEVARVEAAEAADIEEIMPLAHNFWSYNTAYRIPFDPRTTEGVLRQVEKQGLLFVLRVDDGVEGFVAGTIVPMLCNAWVMQVTELAIWVTGKYRGNGYGKALLEALEREAREQGAKYLNLTTTADAKEKAAAAMYEAAGFRRTESTYIKELT